MTPEQTGQAMAFIVAVADHFDAPGPSNEKTAAYYQLASQARLYRAMILQNLGAFEALPPHQLPSAPTA